MIDPSVADAIIKSAGEDPMISGFKWFGVVVVVVLAAAAPLMSYVRKWREDSAANARDGAAAALYSQLKEQLRQNSEDIRELVREKNHWFETATRLASRVEKLEAAEKALHEKELENQRLTSEMSKLTERIHQLELRLAKSDGHCEGCIYGTKVLKVNGPT